MPSAVDRPDRSTAFGSRAARSRRPTLGWIADNLYVSYENGGKFDKPGILTMVVDGRTADFRTPISTAL